MGVSFQKNGSNVSDVEPNVDSIVQGSIGCDGSQVGFKRGRTRFILLSPLSGPCCLG